jgi:hypothetical protein
MRTARKYFIFSCRIDEHSGQFNMQVLGRGGRHFFHTDYIGKEQEKVHCYRTEAQALKRAKLANTGGDAPYQVGIMFI